MAWDRSVSTQAGQLHTTPGAAGRGAARSADGPGGAESATQPLRGPAPAETSKHDRQPNTELGTNADIDTHISRNIRIGMHTAMGIDTNTQTQT